ncbi:MAG: 5'-nucleotidase C-terminal domain-containing protein [Defluviitaleaceae bacterium]|nr:5'-nucleotidase C-terminal domain-containing protein [Defluviitaleaceae bacterium]MCL2276184.1 5'-nucleotidase C-terminal domain-containing protein [Defluviitaleaceae bacterium]
MAKQLRKWICVLLAVCLAGALLPIRVTASSTYEGKTVILHTGNIRGNVSILPQIVTARAHFEALGANVILVDTGNFLHGTRYTAFNSGSTMITLMLAAGYDVLALGTYDFAFGTGTIGAARMAEMHGDVIDFGPLGELLEAHPALRAISANINGVNEFFHSFTANTSITTDSGVTVGFFGLTCVETPNVILESNLTGMQFTNPTAAAQAQTQALASADIIIGLSNANVHATAGAVMVNTAASAIPGGVTAGVIVINNATLAYETRAINLGDFTPDAALQYIIDEFTAEVAAAFPRVFTSTVTLDGSIAGNRSGETNLGNFWADALRRFAVSGEINAFFDEDDVANGNDRIHVSNENVVAIWNAGNLRDFLHPGEVILQDLRRILPFPNTVAIVYLTGAELLEQLEASAQGVPHSAQTHALSASFMHVSGIEYTIDVNRPFNAGEAYRDRIWHRANSVERVTITSVNGRPFDANALYAVITSNANFNGMDASYVLNARPSDAENWSTITTARVVDHAVMGYIATLPQQTIGTAQAALQGRITVTQPFVPLRATAEALGAQVQWDAETAAAVIVTADGRTLTIDVREKTVRDGRTYVSPAFITEIFGA